GHLNDDWFPETARMVVHFSRDAVNVQVDPSCPDRWREEPYASKLCELSLNGMRPIGNPGYATLVVAGSDKFLLLGRTAVPDPTPFGTALMPSTPETFHYWKARHRSMRNGSMNASRKYGASSRNSGIARSPTTTTHIRPTGPPCSDYPNIHTLIRRSRSNPRPRAFAPAEARKQLSSSGRLKRPFVEVATIPECEVLVSLRRFRKESIFPW